MSVVNGKRPRVALLVNGMAPYRIPVYNHLAEHEAWDFEVVYLTKKTPDRQWLVNESEIKFKYRVLPGWHYNPGSGDWTLQINPTIISYLLARNPDVVITAGYDAPAHWAAWAYRRFRRSARLVLWGSSTFLSSRVTGGPGWRLKRAFASSCDACVSYGALATEYLVALGVPGSRIATGCNVGSIEYFKDTVESMRSDPSFADTRSRHPRCVLVFAGKLIPRKGVHLLLNALSQVEYRNWQLFIVGNGPLRPALEGTANAKLGGKVTFLDFSQWDRLAHLYALADIGVIPSTIEVGSIVFSEYLASGLFVLGSKYDASTHSLLVPGVNGAMIDPNDEDRFAGALSEAMARCTSGDLDRTAITETLRGRGPREYAEAVTHAVRLATS